jgi:hypothetical protein
MAYSLHHVATPVFADARKPGYQGVLEVISFLVMTAMIVGAYVSAGTLLVLRCIHAFS